MSYMSWECPLNNDYKPWQFKPGSAARKRGENPIRIDGETVVIIMDKGEVLVDAADYEKVRPYWWYSQKIGYTRYARTSSRKFFSSMHRLILEPPKNMVVDHINGNGLDNRRCNIRICTQAENLKNRRHVLHVLGVEV